MKYLITGSSGFIASHLINKLFSQKNELIGVSRHSNRLNTKLKSYKADICDGKKISVILKKEKPDIIFHLAAQTRIPTSFISPHAYIEVNINGILNILEFLRQSKSKATFISVGSSAEYGRSAQKVKLLDESAKLSPTSPYGVSKVAQGELVRIYGTVYPLNTVHVRPFAVIGPGKTGDAISDFARGIVAVERSRAKYISVGELSHARDFIDVRDMVAGMKLISENMHKAFDRVFNICLGRKTKLQDALEILVSLSKVKIRIKKNSQMPRLVDDPILVGSPAKLFSLGFMPRYQLEDTLKDILEYWRQRD